MPARTRTVLFIASQPFLQWRGTPLRIGFDVRALGALGYTVDLLTLPLGNAESIPGVRVLRVPNLFRARDVPIGPSLVKALFDGVLLVAGLGLILRRRYAVVHGVEDSGILAWLLGRCNGARVVFEKHSDVTAYRKGPLRRLVMAAYGAVERFTIRHADAVIGTGPGLVREAAALRGNRAVHHIFDIPSSCVEAEPGRSAALRAQYRQADGETLALFVGSFAVYQGVDLLFEAAARLAARRPDVRFLIVGGTPDAIAARRAWLEARGAAEHVTFLGKLPPDDLPHVLAAADILLSPRTAGVNTPLKLLDYFKAGRAIVATDMPSHRLILDADTALLTAPAPAAFAAGIERLLDDGALRSRLGAAGRRRYETTYTFSAFTSRLGACYSGLLGEDAE
jgi:glycosyltransferase involved in cell wall biosynthesis